MRVGASGSPFETVVRLQTKSFRAEFPKPIVMNFPASQCTEGVQDNLIFVTVELIRKGHPCIALCVERQALFLLPAVKFESTRLRKLRRCNGKPLCQAPTLRIELIGSWCGHLRY